MAVTYDELYISTMREINVCRKSIERLKKTIEHMEEKYCLKTRQFVAQFEEGGMKGHKEFVLWYESHAAMKKWEESLREFNEILEMY